MLAFVKAFHEEEYGAVTVDWVVLTAGLTAFGATIVLIVSTAARDPAESVGAQLTAMEIE